MSAIQSDLRGLGNVNVKQTFPFLCLSIFVLLTAFQDIFSIEAFFYVRLMFIGVIFFFLNTTSMCKVYLFLLFLTSDITLYWLNVCFGLLYILKGYRSIRFTNTIKIAVVLILFEFLHFFIYMGEDLSFVHFIKQGGFGLVLLSTLFIIQRSDSLTDFPTYISYWVRGLLCACVIFYVKYIMRFGIRYALSFSAGIGLNSQIDSIYTFHMHPNMVSRLCGVTLSMLLVLMILNKALQLHLHQGRILTTCGLLCFFGMLTGSMSFYLMLGSIAILIMITGLRDFNMMRFLKMAILLVVVLLCMALIIQTWFPNAISRAVNDLFSSDVSTGRFGIWEDSIQVMLKAPWIFITGIGMQDYRSIMISMFQLDTDLLHNVLLEIVLAWGIVGVLLVGAMLLTALKEKVKVPAFHAIWLGYVPMVVIGIVFMTGNFFYGYYMNFSFLIMTLLFAAYINDKRGQLNGEGA